jgi:hypothetical protein
MGYLHAASRVSAVGTGIRSCRDPRQRSRISHTATVNHRTPSTIEEIEGVRQPEPGSHATTLVQRCAALRRKPLTQFTNEDLRIMLGQQIAVPILLPRAVSVLADDPLAEGDYYPGDLLYTVLRLPEHEWRGAERHRQRLIEVLRAASLPSDDLHADLRSAVAAFTETPRIEHDERPS